MAPSSRPGKSRHRKRVACAPALMLALSAADGVILIAAKSKRDVLQWQLFDGQWPTAREPPPRRPSPGARSSGYRASRWGVCSLSVVSRIRHLSATRKVIDRGGCIGPTSFTFVQGFPPSTANRKPLPPRGVRDHPLCPMPNMTLHEIAHTVGAELPTDADPAMSIFGATTLEEAQSGQIAFYEHPKYLRALRTTKAGVVIVPPTFDEVLVPVVLRVDNPPAAFGAVLEILAPAIPHQQMRGIHPTALVHDTAEIDPSASIEPFAVIEAGVQIGPRSIIGAQAFVGRHSRLGEDCHIHPRAVLREGCILGSRVIVQSGAVIGSIGFGFSFVQGGIGASDIAALCSSTTTSRSAPARRSIEADLAGRGFKPAPNSIISCKSPTTWSSARKLPHCRPDGRISRKRAPGQVCHPRRRQVGVVGDTSKSAIKSSSRAKGGVSKDAAPNQQLMGTYGIPAKEARGVGRPLSPAVPKTVAKIKALEQEVERFEGTGGKISGRYCESGRVSS